KTACPSAVLRIRMAKVNCSTNPHSTVRHGKRLRLAEIAQATPRKASSPSKLISFSCMAHVSELDEMSRDLSRNAPAPADQIGFFQIGTTRFISSINH